MELNEEQLRDGIIKVNLSGRMDIEGVRHVESKLAEFGARSGLGLIVNMADVPYMSSIGIRALLMTAKSVSKKNGKFSILGPQPNVRKVLETSGIDRLISICSDLDSAIASVAS